jgi:DNA-directed RNA polymerase subunit N (RpoN/RPB10)
MYIDYATNTRVQQRINNGGTELATVFAVEDGKVTRVFSREESYYRENFINKPENRQEILLMEPIEAGTAWTLPDGRTRTITDTAAAVATPSGTYSAVAVETEYGDSKTTQYYAKGVGLVKTVTVGPGYEVSSSLSEIQTDTPFAQTVRFYYPDVGNDRFCCRDTVLSFRTNDVTRMVLAEAYKADFPGRPGSVLTANTAINSLYLNDDGMVYIDLSGEFITEMNAGSGAEAMILQCVANTFGGYYGVGRVILTVDNALYESGHIALRQGEYLTVDTEGAVPLA